MDKSKGMTITSFFIYLAFIFMILNLGFGILSLMEKLSLDLFLVSIVDIVFLVSYYLLLRDQKIGLYLLLINMLIYIVIDIMFLKKFFFFSFEFFITIFVVCGVSSKIKDLR